LVWAFEKLQHAGTLFKPLPHGKCTHVYVRCCACRRREYERDPGMLLRQLQPIVRLKLVALKKFFIRLQATEADSIRNACFKLFTQLIMALQFEIPFLILL
jgi:hypothetical protein